MFFSINGGLYTPAQIASAMGESQSLYRGIDGKPCERTKDSHPYAYDEFVIWGGFGPVGDSAVYSDRMHAWDSKKYDRLLKKHYPEGNGPSWRNVPRAAMTAFFREFYNDPGLYALRLTEMCNVATGYPLWCVYYTHGQEFNAHVAAFVATERALRVARDAQAAAAKARESLDVLCSSPRRIGTSKSTAWRTRRDDRQRASAQLEVSRLYRVARELHMAAAAAKSEEVHAGALLARAREMAK